MEFHLRITSEHLVCKNTQLHVLGWLFRVKNTLTQILVSLSQGFVKEWADFFKIT